MPAQELLRTLLARVQALIARSEPKPFIADDRLEQATMTMLDQVVAPPACGPVLEELDRTVAAWCTEDPRVSTIKMVVLPPCDENEIIRSWADQHGHTVLEPPPRAMLVDVPASPLPDLVGDGVLVIPRLEEWFLRHRNGLRTVRALLEALEASRRLTVIGCNSWAWSFLGKAVGADLLMPDAVTFLAFDEMRLYRWFKQLATSDETGTMRFRQATSGADVLKMGEDGAPEDDYLRTLAGRSLGIPWVAWHMWRRSLRSGHPGDEDGDAPAPDAPAQDLKALASADGDPGEQTLWVAALDEFVLPGAHEQSALLILQALLIHGALDPGQLRLVLPLVGETSLITVLVKAGFIARNADGLYACRAAAYPAIRAGLLAAGMPLDQI